MATITIAFDETNGNVGISTDSNISRIVAFGMLEVARDLFKGVFDANAQNPTDRPAIAIVPASALGNGRGH